MRTHARLKQQPTRRTPTTSSDLPRRILRGLSYTDAARQIGISVSYLHLILNGRRRPSAAVALRISKILNIPIESLVQELDPRDWGKKKGKAGR
jgi:transcriptional regulator with XRE-family HTH domain